MKSDFKLVIFQILRIIIKNIFAMNYEKLIKTLNNLHFIF